MATKTARAKSKPIEDFDETTPPPRTRPQGEPPPKWVELPPGESPIAAFLGWDRAGRIPEGSVLCEFVGTLLDPKRSGFTVAAVPETGPQELRTALGAVGTAVKPRAIHDYQSTSTIKQGHRRFVVLAPQVTA